MAGSVNKAIIIGNLGKDPEIRRLNDGKPVASLTIATSETWRDKSSGERKEKTEWHKVVIFSEGLCKIAEQYLRKGSKVYIEGQIQTRKWIAQDGTDRYSTEIVLQAFNGVLTMLEGPSKSEPDAEHHDQRPISERAMPRAPARGSARNADMDDPIPFAPEFR